MADIHIHRAHSLGLTKAREMAAQWAQTAEQKFDMECTVVEREDTGLVEFKRAGVDGQLLVSAQAFDLTARLGFLLRAFSKKIEADIESNLDSLLAAGDRKTAKSKAVKKQAGARKPPA